MAGLLRDPRVRLLVVVVLALASFALVWHLVGMGDHAGGRSRGEIVMAAAALLVARHRGRDPPRRRSRGW